MRKILALLSVLVIVLTVSFPVKAENQSNAIITANLTFNGISTATCSLDVNAGNASYPIVATVTLKHGSTIVKNLYSPSFFALRKLVRVDTDDNVGIGFGNDPLPFGKVARFEIFQRVAVQSLLGLPRHHRAEAGIGQLFLQ